MKHAYLIIAHNEPELFGILVSLLDDARNDIYVMIDQKVDIVPFKKYSTRQSKLIFLEPRIKNYWGMFAQVEIELALFSKAYESGESYTYYHLLSGADLPIKTQDEIHAFFQQKKSDDGMPLEFISFWEGEKHERDLRYKMGYHIPLKKYFRAKGAVGWVFDRIRRVCYEAQRLVGYSKKYPGVTFKKGDNWVSLSDRGVGYLLERRDIIRRIFKGSICPDEIYKQTLLYMSPLRKYIYSPKNSEEACVRAIDWERRRPYFPLKTAKEVLTHTHTHACAEVNAKTGRTLEYCDNFYNTVDENKGCLREIDWQRGRPYVWQKEDEVLLTQSPAFFARKFSLQTPEGREIVEIIARNVAQRKKKEGLA